MRPIDADALTEILTTAIRNMEGLAKFIGCEDDPEIKMEIKAYRDILNGVKEQPTIEPERKKGKLIPCSKKLPDIKEHHCSEPCIVYCENGAYGFAELEENIFGQVGWNCERDDEYHEPLGKVLAWMPLPEPYRGGETDEGN